jgi:hypothetical protein
MTDAKRRCTHTTQAGQPCKAWAVHGTEPPACSIHAGLTRGGPAERNQNARKHGFYAAGIKPSELRDLIYLPENLDSIDDEIIVAKIALRRVLIFLDHNGDLTPADFLAAARLVLQATRTVALLLRDKRALGGEAADSFLQSLGVALDELNTMWHLEGDLKL